MLNFLIGFACGVAVARSPIYPAFAAGAKSVAAYVKGLFTK